MSIYESIAKIMSEVPAISKGQTNKQQGFKYRGIDDVMNAFQPILAKNKVFIVPEVLEQSREERQTKSGGNLIYSILKIKFKFFAEDGTFVEAITIGEGMDSADKSSNKAMAVAMKYAMFQVFCIPTEEMVDPDAETPENSYKKGAAPNKPKAEPKKQEPKITSDYINSIKNFIVIYAEMKNGKAEELEKYYLTKFKAGRFEDLTQKQGDMIINELNKFIDKEGRTR